MLGMLGRAGGWRLGTVGGRDAGVGVRRKGGRLGWRRVGGAVGK